MYGEKRKLEPQTALSPLPRPIFPFALRPTVGACSQAICFRCNWQRYFSSRNRLWWWGVACATSSATCLSVALVSKLKEELPRAIAQSSESGSHEHTRTSRAARECQITTRTPPSHYAGRDFCTQFHFLFNYRERKASRNEHSLKSTQNNSYYYWYVLIWVI